MSKARCFGHATHSPWEPLLCGLVLYSYRLSCCQGTEFMRIPIMIVPHTLLASCQALRYCVPVDMSGTWFPILMGRFDWRLRWFNGNSAKDGSCESIDWGRSKAEHWHVRVLSRLPSFVQGVFNILNLSLNAENPTLWRTAFSFDSHNVGHCQKWWLRVSLVLTTQTFNSFTTVWKDTVYSVSVLQNVSSRALKNATRKINLTTRNDTIKDKCTSLKDKQDTKK